MFGILAALGPVGIVAAVVGTVATAVIASDSGSSKRGSNRRDVERDYEEEKRTTLKEDIEKYIKKQTIHMKNKYNAEILIDTSSFNSFDDSVLRVLDGVFGRDGMTVPSTTTEKSIKIVTVLKKDTILKGEIKKLKTKDKELQELIVFLVGEKNAVCS